jgi:hypothetical protein
VNGHQLTEKQKRVLQAVAALSLRSATEWDVWNYGNRQMWWGSTGLFGFLKKLTDYGYLQREKPSTVWHYRLTDKGREAVGS